MSKILKIGIIAGVGIILTVLAISYFNENIQEERELSTPVQTEGMNQMMQIEISIEEFEELQYSNEEKSVVIFPIFTGFAYEENGFYDYYKGECGESCLTKTMSSDLPLQYASSQQGFMLLQLLNYPYLTDLDVARNPEILKNYDKVIVLHNEYVTRDEFNAITNHPNVVYLYPNALYAEVDIDYEENTITLIRGHGYPDPEITNGFNWKFENTKPYEYDVECENWDFYEIDNGHMLNCYPENVIVDRLDIIRAMKQY